MGYIRHHCIVVTGGYGDFIREAHKIAKQDFGDLVSKIIKSYANGYETFFVAPDGSKEGWDGSNNGDIERKEFIEWLDAQRYSDGSTPLSWAEIQYGDDDGETIIVSHSEQNHRRKAGVLAF